MENPGVGRKNWRGRAAWFTFVTSFFLILVRGSSHLAIGLITGVGIAAVTSDVRFSLPGIALAGFSSLAPDLDHPNSRLSKRMGFLQSYVRWAFAMMAVMLAIFAYLNLPPGPNQRVAYTAALATFLIGMAMQNQAVRKLALLFTGAASVLIGLYEQMLWLSLLGAFVTAAPYTSHRSYTHTIWAAAFWTYIGHLANKDLGWHGVAVYAGAGYMSHLLADTLTKSGVRYFLPLSDKALKVPLISTGSTAGNLLELGICAAYGLVVALLWWQRYNLS
ncbi:metal-dependent hydrolase [Hymenobacter jeollabukensis]|uniref:Metal-dependent hydrolase n=1 Tax=Hymenobacter jeollabukensis TaxID=2025313 RepID=A0A5R8WSU2_9BACT|nr:metal-dependent hydrolase [Hymenobacter jeollabukensis]TLM94253.1 metal-dependent hydrolase [Hymenobacter jeollabukensis]